MNCYKKSKSIIAILKVQDMYIRQIINCKKLIEHNLGFFWFH